MCYFFQITNPKNPIRLLMSQDLGAAHGRFTTLSGFDYEPFQRARDDCIEKATYGEDIDLPLPLWQYEHRLLTPPTTLLRLDLSEPINFNVAAASKHVGEYRSSSSLVPIAHRGMAHAVVMWMDADLSYGGVTISDYCYDTDGSISTSGGIHGSKQCVRFLPEGRPVEPGVHELVARSWLNVIAAKVDSQFDLVERDAGVAALNMGE